MFSVFEPPEGGTTNNLCVGSTEIRAIHFAPPTTSMLWLAVIARNGAALSQPRVQRREPKRTSAKPWVTNVKRCITLKGNAVNDF